MKKIELYDYLHNNKGLSTAKIAKLLNVKKNSVLCLLRNHKLLKPSKGRDIEDRVARWLEDRGNKVIRQKGDHPFDLLVNNKKRIDVKSSSLSFDKNSNKFSYHFQLKYKNNIYGDYHKEKDEFYLVFLGKKNIPIYNLSSNRIFVKRQLTIPYSLKTKYPLKFIGYLES